MPIINDQGLTSPIKTPVVISQPDVETASLEVDVHAGQDADALIVKDELGQTRARIFAGGSSSGYSLIEVDDPVAGGSAIINASVGGSISSSASFAPALALRNLGGGKVLQIKNTAAADVGGFLPEGFFYVATHAAPPDATVNPGQAVIWFDQTNGAAKLMIKAKTPDTTVVTASINLA